MSIAIVAALLLIAFWMQLTFWRHWRSREMLIPLSIWTLASAATRTLVELGTIDPHDGLTFTGALGFGILPSLVLARWRYH